jgi:hypothetical protein
MRSNVVLKINGNDYSAIVLSPLRIGRHKLWGDDTGRVMSGDFFGTLTGIFPKITASFFPETDEELEQLIDDLDSPSQILEYYNPKKRTTTSLGTYTNDYDILLGVGLDLDDAIVVSFIADKKE